jgi:hypothetical protein
MESIRKHILSLILFITFFQISNIAFSQSTNNRNYLELTNGWKYRWGESPLNEAGVPLWTIEDTLSEEWKSVEYKKGILNPLERQQKKILWLCAKIPEGKWRDPHIFIENVRFACEVYLESQRIYQTKGMNEPGIHNIVPTWHLIPLEFEYQNKLLFFRIYSDDPRSMGIEPIFLGSKSDFIKKMVGDRIQLIIFGD